MSSSNPHPLAHEHVFLGRSHDENTRRTIWVVALTGVMMVGEIVAGVVYNSMALLADGVHMATHAGALAVAAGAYAVAKKYAHDGRFTFGTGKVGDLAGFASALTLGFISIAIIFESALRLMNPGSVKFAEATVVAAIGLVVNVISAFVLGAGHGHAPDHPHAAHSHDHDHDDHHHHHHGDRHPGHPSGRDNNMRSAFAHVVADAMTSVLAIIALLAGRFLGWVWLDPVIAIFGALVIASWSWALMRDSAAVLLDVSDGRLEGELRKRLQNDGRVAITDLHVWKVGPESWAAIVSAAGEADEAEIRARLTEIPGLDHLTVETRSAA